MPCENCDKLQAENERLRGSGWRACIDHIIRPDSPCPVCRIEKLEAVAEAAKNLYNPSEELEQALAALEDKC